jgi:hypothetical protein
MTKPVSQADEPTLFPRGWVIGRAAADLVQDDEGVLLDQPWVDPLAGDPRAGAGPRSAAGDPPAGLPAQAPARKVAQSADDDTGAAVALRSAAHPGTAPTLPVTADAPTRRRAAPPTAAEIDELKAGLARLQRRFEAARMRPRPRYLDAVGGRAATSMALVAEAPARAVARRPFPWRRIALTLVLAALASGLYQYRAVLFQF